MYIGSNTASNLITRMYNNIAGDYLAKIGYDIKSISNELTRKADTIMGKSKKEAIENAKFTLDQQLNNGQISREEYERQMDAIINHQRDRRAQVARDDDVDSMDGIFDDVPDAGAAGAAAAAAGPPIGSGKTLLIKRKPEKVYRTPLVNPSILQKHMKN
jgi:hypothetical protein